MNPTDILLDLGLALGLGLLVGLQRERAKERLAGMRTFALATVFGAVCGLLAEPFGGWLVAAGLLGLTGLIVTGNLAAQRAGEFDPGQTTEVALLLMFGVGATAVVAPPAVATVAGAGVAVLLHMKEQLHGLAGRIRDQDFKAMMQFALISLVVLPVLPDRGYGPYEVWNPFQIWLMVVLIVGLGLAAYLAYQLFGGGKGTLVGGLLGGLVSSTATTVSYARRTRETPELVPSATLVLVLAAGVVFVRVLIEIAVVSRELLRTAWPTLAAMLALFALLAVFAWRRDAGRLADPPPPANPSELRPALAFAALYAVVLLAVAWAGDRLGDSGLYGVAALSGLTDLDAITLSTARLVHEGQVEAVAGSRAVLLAGLSNLVFKAATVAFLGDRGLTRRIAVLFGIAVAAGGAMLAIPR